MAAVAHAPPMPAGHASTSRPQSAQSIRESRNNSLEIAIPEEEDKKVKEEGSPTNRTRPPIRPNAAVRSKFDLEPNPFEQSFSRSSHHSNSSLSDKDRTTTPPRGGDATAIKHNALPPLSSLTSPAAADPSQFPWLANQSLRTGPLSPAMLAGPAQNGMNNHRGNGGDTGNNDTGGFDSSTFRTGFTPGTGSGFTPAFGSLMGGANGGNYSTLPLPSPNTAAFLNAVTNATPIESGDGIAGQGSQDHHQQHNGHHNPHIHLQPPSAIPPHLHQHHGLSHINNDHSVPQDTITPNTLSALTGVFNDMNRQAGNPPPPSYYPQQMHHMQQQQHQQHHQQQQQPLHHQQSLQHVPSVDYAQQTANAASQAANGLFLLSQAHQELSKREQEDIPIPNSATSQPQSATTKKGGSAAGGAGSGKRKSDAAANGPKPPAAKRGKKQSLSAEDKNLVTMNNKMEESASPEFSVGDMEDDGVERLNANGKPETEEEKRKNFLERNRQAALKCRQRKKAWLGELQTKVESLTMENDRLQQTIASLHEEVQRLSGMLMQHRECGVQMNAPNYIIGRPTR